MAGKGLIRAGVVAAAGLLSACGDGNAPDDAAGAARIESDLPSGSSTEVPPDLPGGFDVIDGATIDHVADVMGANGRVVTITMRSDAAPDTLIAYYRRQATASGIAVEPTVEVGDSFAIGGTAPDGRSFAFNAGDVRGETRAMLILIGEGS